jgi:hypothetical protein
MTTRRRLRVRSWPILAWPILPWTGLALPALGCASDPMPEIRAAYYAGNYAWANEELGKLVQDDPSNAHVYRLERSMTELALLRPQDAEAELRRARDRLDDLAGSTSATEWLASVMLDDRQLDYTGADYEHVLVRAMLAIANLLSGGGDAEAYAIQVLQRQLEIMNSFEQNGDNPKLRYKLVAFGSYLRGILNDDDPVRLGVAREAFGRAVELEPECRVAQEALERVTSGRHSAPGNGVVHVLALVGRAPFRVERDERASKTALALAQLIWALSRDRVTFPAITDVKVPALAIHRDNPAVAYVGVDGQTVGQTETVTDVDQLAIAEFSAMHDNIVARAVLRRAFKIVVTEGVKEVVNPARRNHEPDPLVDLAISLGGLLWTGVESADLRCWSLLPARFQALRIELPAGDHEITLSTGGGAPATQSVRVRVRDGFNTYVVGLLPTYGTCPPPLTSEPAELADTL